MGADTKDLFTWAWLDTFTWGRCWGYRLKPCFLQKKPALQMPVLGVLAVTALPCCVILTGSPQAATRYCNWFSLLLVRSGGVRFVKCRVCARGDRLALFPPLHTCCLPKREAGSHQYSLHSHVPAASSCRGSSQHGLHGGSSAGKGMDSRGDGRRQRRNVCNTP